MKAFFASITALAIASLSSVAIALSPPAPVTDPIEAFKQDQAVIDAQTAVNNDKNLVLDPEISKALLGGGCGFAGCDTSYLVTQGYATVGTNPQVQVISAVVKISSLQEPKVTLVPVDSLFQ
jgi:hypothetical protein